MEEDESGESALTIYHYIMHRLDEYLSDNHSTISDTVTNIALHDANIKLKAWALDIDLEKTSVLTHTGLHDQDLSKITSDNLLELKRVIDLLGVHDTRRSKIDIRERINLEDFEFRLNNVIELAELLVAYWENISSNTNLSSSPAPSSHLRVGSQPAYQVIAEPMSRPAPQDISMNAHPGYGNVADRKSSVSHGLPMFDLARSPPTTSSKSTKHVPCKFFRQGTCQAGSACPFSHSMDPMTQQAPCKYFMKGNCKLGAKCPLAHYLPDGRRVNRADLDAGFAMAGRPSHIVSNVANIIKAVDGEVEQPGKISTKHELPFALPFFLRIKHVQYEEDSDTPTPSYGPDDYWRPSASGHFVCKSSSHWWIWDPGEHQRQDNLHRLRRPTQEEFANLRLYKKCTMIWDPERGGYIQVPLDCTVQALSPSHMWRRLSFGRSEEQHHEHIAIVGHNRERQRLHFRGPEFWFEQLLPKIYRAQDKGLQRCMLAGDLSLLVGLIAFSTEPKYACRALDLSFRLNVNSTKFRGHTLPKGPTDEKRSMVIEIGFDRTKVNAAHLRAWENGEFGEIFS